MSNQTLYPPNPTGVSVSVTAASAAFRREVKKVLFSIVSFFFVYLLIVALAVALSVACVYAGFYIMIGFLSILGILLGLGVTSIGIIVLIFLVKFIFSVRKFDESGSIRVTEDEQPGLFAFIKQLTNDTGTNFPKKIMLSPEVNACVYYNDSFWSMLFPVKKNLNIGLGLVNTLTISEFKAVMAHEFGHFSQRSMKLGSFVYNVNKVIYNLLYENRSFSSFIQGWGNLHWAIGIFVIIASEIIKGIQKILQLMYGFINKNYMALSREMEFHADAVAASLNGSANCNSALDKMEISEICYQAVLNKANELLQHETAFKNIYESHVEVMRQYAGQQKLPLENDTPVPDDSFFKKFQLNKVNIKNQWASHPSREDRKSHLDKLGIDAVKDGRPAWTIFQNVEHLQETMSNVVYREVPREKINRYISTATFGEQYAAETAEFSFPPQYNGYYDNRLLPDMDIDAISTQPFDLEINEQVFSLLFSNEQQALIKKAVGSMQDEELLRAIAENKIAVKTFDYDGKKMNKAEAADLLEKLEKEHEEQKVQIQAHDEKVVRFFCEVCSRSGTIELKMLKDKYRAYLDNKNKGTLFISAGERILGILGPLFSGHKVSIEAAGNMAASLRAESDVIRPMIRSLIELKAYHHVPQLRTQAAAFSNSEFVYFEGNSFLSEQLNCLHQLVIESPSVFNQFQLRSFKSILEYQLEEFQKITASHAQ